jgi:hypothetical protein
MHIYFPAIDPGVGDPTAVFGKNAADLVDIHFFPFFLFPELVDLNGYREGLFRYYDGIEIGIKGGTEAVIQRLNYPGSLVAAIGDILLQFLLPYLKWADRVDFFAGKGIGSKAYHDMSTGTGDSE